MTLSQVLFRLGSMGIWFITIMLRVSYQSVNTSPTFSFVIYLILAQLKYNLRTKLWTMQHSVSVHALYFLFTQNLSCIITSFLLVTFFNFHYLISNNVGFPSCTCINNVKGSSITVNFFRIYITK